MAWLHLECCHSIALSIQYILNSSPQSQQLIFTIVYGAHSPLLWKSHTQHVKLLSQGQTHSSGGKNIVCWAELIKLEGPAFPACCCQRGCSALFCHTDWGLLSNVHGLQYLLSHHQRGSIWGLGAPAALIDALRGWMPLKLLMRFDWDSRERTDSSCQTGGVCRHRWIRSCVWIVLLTVGKTSGGGWDAASESALSFHR